jgi:hypothetical protein
MPEQGKSRTGRMIFQRFGVGEEIGGEDGKRLTELEEEMSGRPLSDEEMEEMRRIAEAHGKRAFLEGPEFTKLGVTDPEQFLENFGDISNEAEEAYQDVCFLEAISLRLLTLDFMLRAYIVNTTGNPIKPYSGQDRWPFGRLITEAEKHGLPQDLVADLRAFNHRRNAGIHHYVLGRTSYQEIGDAYRDADWLVERIIMTMDLPPMGS